MSAEKPRDRKTPNRSPDQWARQFQHSLRKETGVICRLSDITRIATGDKRLRERRPASVVKIVKDSAAAAGFPVEKWLMLIRLRPPLIVRRPSSVARGLKEIRTVLGVSADEARRAVRREPFLLCFAAGGLRKRFAALTDLFGLSHAQARRCAKRDPRLLTRKPRALASLALEQRRLLVLSPAEYRQLLLKDPRILARSGKAIHRFLDGMVELWGLQPGEARTLLVKAPVLAVSGRAEVMQNRFLKLASGLGCEMKEIMKAVRAFPSLAYQDPVRLLAKVDNAAASLWIDRQVLGASMLRSPSLFGRKTEGWKRRMRLICRIVQALGLSATSQDVFESLPAAMTYGEGRLLQRYVVARLGLWTWNWETLLTFSDVKIRKRLNEYFGHHPQRAALRQALQRRGLL